MSEKVKEIQIRRCRACKQRVRLDAARCPHCGHRVPTGTYAEAVWHESRRRRPMLGCALLVAATVLVSAAATTAVAAPILWRHSPHRDQGVEQRHRGR